MQPDLIITPFGENASAGTLDPIPESVAPGDLPQRASWNAGFPGITMIPLEAGGLPPRGQDVNGVLNAISEHTVFVGGGGQYKWDSAFAAANGYQAGAVVQKIGLDGFWLNLVAGNTTDPDAGGAGWIDIASTTLPYALDAGAPNAYVVTYDPALSGLRNGIVVRFKSSNSNTGASTLNANGLGARPIVSLEGQQLRPGDIPAGAHVWVQYDTSIGGGSWVGLLIKTPDYLNSQRVDVASAATVDLSALAPDTRHVRITGSASISAFTIAAGRCYFVTLDAGVTLANGASLVTGSGANILATAGDTCVIYATAANVVRVMMYTRAIPQTLGYGQTLQSFAIPSERNFGVTYTNTTGRTIGVSIAVQGGATVDVIRFTVGGVIRYEGDPGTGTPGTAVYLYSEVAPGETYSLVSTAGSTTAFQWVERR